MMLKKRGETQFPRVGVERTKGFITYDVYAGKSTPSYTGIYRRRTAEGLLEHAMKERHGHSEET